MRRISRRPVGSGMPMSSSRSKRPKRRRAGSMLLGRLVAAMTMIWARDFRPSMRVRSCDTIRRSTSPPVLSLFGAMESTSSIKMIDGAFFSASSKALRRLLSDSPAILDMISGPLIKKKKRASLVCDSTGKQGLTSTRRAVEKNTLGRLDTDALEQRRVTNGQLH
eukprot:09460_2